MNQILSTENINAKSKKTKGASKDIHSIVKFFAIVLIIFGIFLVASSSYALYKGNNDETNISKGTQSTAKPNIQAEIKDETHIILTVIGEVEIKEIEYYWNDEKVETIQGNGNKYIQTNKIEIPQGDNTFKVKATDINGQVAEYTNTYSIKRDIVIESKQSGNNVKINVKANEKLKSVEYTWDNDETKSVEANDDTECSFEVEVSQGEHVLIVKVTDEKGNEEEKKIDVIGTTKPTVKIEAGNDSYVIKAHDEAALDRVEIETVSDGKVTKMQADGKDFEYNFPLKEGDDNYIKVTAYNTKGVASKTVKAVWKK